MSITTYTRVPTYAAAGVGLAAAVALGVEQVWQTFAPQTPPRFVHLPSLNPASTEVVPAFHGMQGDDSQFAPLSGYFTGIGETLLVNCGTNSLATPAAAVRELGRLGLVNRSIMLVGVSLGTNKAVRALRLCRKLGIRVSGIVLISGPPTPGHVIWPHWAYKLGLRLLRGGPLSSAIWRRMNLRALETARVLEATDPEAAARAILDAERCQRIPAVTMTSSASLLRQGPRLKPNEFPDVECLVIERSGDPLILPGFAMWQGGFPLAERYFIEDPPGHATLGDCPEEYIGAITQWRERRVLPRLRLSSA